MIKEFHPECFVTGYIGFAGVGSAGDGFAEVGFAEVGFAEVGFAEVGFAGRCYRHQRGCLQGSIPYPLLTLRLL